MVRPGLDQPPPGLGEGDLDSDMGELPVTEGVPGIGEREGADRRPGALLLAPLLADRDEDGVRFKGRICEEERRRWCVELLAGVSEEDENDSGMDESRRAEKRAAGPVSQVQVSNRAILARELAGVSW